MFSFVGEKTEDKEFRVGWTPEDDEYLIELCQEGKSFVQCADIFYSTARNVARHYQVLVRAGKAKPIKINHGQKLNAEKMEYVVSRLNDRRIVELAAELQVSPGAILNRLNNLGWRATRGNKYVRPVWKKAVA